MNTDPPDLAAELDRLNEWNALVYARQMTCDRLDERAWIYRRFPARCHFYPGRDCPGWRRGQECARIGRVIPDD